MITAAKLIAFLEQLPPETSIAVEIRKGHTNSHFQTIFGGKYVQAGQVAYLDCGSAFQADIPDRVKPF